MEPFQLSKKEIANLNRSLDDCKCIEDDLKRAKAAGVPNIEELEACVETCRQRIIALKTQYAKGSK